MVASRLSDSQKAELVERFRRGASTQALAEAYGCSPNTVIRAAKAALEPALYEELKQKRTRRVSGTEPAGQEPSGPSLPAPLPSPAAHEPRGSGQQPSGEAPGIVPSSNDEDGHGRGQGGWAWRSGHRRCRRFLLERRGR